MFWNIGRIANMFDVPMAYALCCRPADIGIRQSQHFAQYDDKYPQRV